jgi:hypothetical protein
MRKGLLCGKYEVKAMKVRRIVSDERIQHRPLPIEYLKTIATHIDLSFDVYSLGRLSPEEMRWNAAQEKAGHRFRLVLD